MCQGAGRRPSPGASSPFRGAGSLLSAAEMPRSDRRPEGTADRLRAEHRREHREHLAWQADIARWRQEFVEAVLDYARRTAPQLEIENYETALDAHEIAIDAHEEMLHRHDTLLDAEAHGGPVTSDEMAQFQSGVEDRHARSRDEHRQLEITHQAILRALRMLGKAR